MIRTSGGSEAELHASAMYAEDLTARSLGITIEDVAEGRATARLRVDRTMVNGHGMAHGGYLFLLADVAFAYACNSRGGITVAQSAQVTFVRPAAVGDELVAEAVEKSASGRGGIYDVTVRKASGTVVAEFRGQSRSLS